MWMLRFPALHLSTVFHMRRWCRGIHKSHEQILQPFRALWLRCMCSAVIVSVQPVQHVAYWLEMQKHVEYVSCKSRAFAGAVASMCWHSWAIRKQANIESSHLIVTCTKVAARYDTGSNQQPTSAQSTADGRLRAVKFPGNPRQEHFLVDWNFWQRVWKLLVSITLYLTIDHAF